MLGESSHKEAWRERVEKKAVRAKSGETSKKKGAKGGGGKGEGVLCFARRGGLRGDVGASVKGC